MLPLLTALLLAIAPAPKTVTHVDLLDRETVLVVYSDLSMAIGSISSFTPTGQPIQGAPLTTISAPTGDKLVTRWTDVKGLTREVITDCGTMKIIDCVIQHNKAVDTLLLAAPVKRDEKFGVLHDFRRWKRAA